MNPIPIHIRRYSDPGSSSLDNEFLGRLDVRSLIKWHRCSSEERSLIRKNESILVSFLSSGLITFEEFCAVGDFKRVFENRSGFMRLLQRGFTADELEGGVSDFLRHEKELYWLLDEGFPKQRILSLSWDHIELLYEHRAFLIGHKECIDLSREEFPFFLAHYRRYELILAPLIPLKEFIALYPDKGRLMLLNLEAFRNFLQRGLTLAQLKEFSYEALTDFLTFFNVPVEEQPEPIKSKLITALQSAAAIDSPISADTPVTDSPRSDPAAAALSTPLTGTFSVFDFSALSSIESIQLAEFAAHILKIPDHFKAWFYHHPEALAKMAEANLSPQFYFHLRQEPEYALIDTPYGVDALKFPDCYFQSALFTHRELLNIPFNTLSPTMKSILFTYPEEFLGLCQVLGKQPQELTVLQDEKLRLLALNYKNVKQPLNLTSSIEELANELGVDAKPYLNQRHRFSPTLVRVLHRLSGFWAFSDDIKNKMPFILENYPTLHMLKKAEVDIQLFLHQFTTHAMELMLYNPALMIREKEQLHQYVGKDMSFFLNHFILLKK